MQTTYAQKNGAVQKASANTAESVIDSSSQSATLQRHASLAKAIAQRAEAPRPNNTGMPDNLKSGIESLSGFSMDDVRVHYNSSKPATVQALAYTQGTDIHVAPGQEKCLPHEAWHVAQQMAGRVSPTTNINGMPVNDNAALEHEADVMGEKAVQCKIPENEKLPQCKGGGGKTEGNGVLQCTGWDYEEWDVTKENNNECMYNQLKNRDDYRIDVTAKNKAEALAKIAEKFAEVAFGWEKKVRLIMEKTKYQYDLKTFLKEGKNNVLEGKKVTAEDDLICGLEMDKTKVKKMKPCEVKSNLEKKINEEVEKLKNKIGLYGYEAAYTEKDKKEKICLRIVYNYNPTGTSHGYVVWVEDDGCISINKPGGAKYRKDNKKVDYYGDTHQMPKKGLKAEDLIPSKYMGGKFKGWGDEYSFFAGEGARFQCVREYFAKGGKLSDGTKFGTSTKDGICYMTFKEMYNDWATGFNSQFNIDNELFLKKLKEKDRCEKECGDYYDVSKNIIADSHRQVNPI